MKLNMMLAALCFIGAYESAMAMDKRDAYLKFKVNKELQIVGHKAKQMELFAKPEEFTGKIITEVIPLSPEDKDALKNGFQNAFVLKKKQKVEYTLEDMRYVAAIQRKKDSFSVKVKEASTVKR